MPALATAKQASLSRLQALHDSAVALGARCGCFSRVERANQSARRLQRYNPNHYGPGERGGQFAPGDDSDAGAGNPTQVAGGGEPDEESGRGRSLIEDEFVDPTAPIRQELYFAARAKLRAIDPSNAAIPSLESPGRVPSKEDVNNMQDALDRAIEDHAATAAEHAYEKHVVDQKEFPEIGSEVGLQAIAQDVMRRSPPEIAPRGRVIFYQSSTNTLVIVNPSNPEENNVFRPDDGRAYVDRLINDK
jgi:hypothetical protein